MIAPALDLRRLTPPASDAPGWRAASWPDPNGARTLVEVRSPDDRIGQEWVDLGGAGVKEDVINLIEAVTRIGERLTGSREACMAIPAIHFDARLQACWALLLMWLEDKRRAER